PVHDRTRSLMNSVVALPGLKALTQLWRTKAEALADRLVAQRHFAIMTGTILAKPLKGKDVISQVIRSIASCYVSQSMSGHAVDGSIETIEYDAELESGGTIHGSVF